LLLSFLPIKNKFDGCHLHPSQRELADKTKSWPDQKKKKQNKKHNNLCKKAASLQEWKSQVLSPSASKQLPSVGGAGGAGAAFIKYKNLQHYAFLVTAKHRIHCWYTRHKSRMRQRINLVPMPSLLDLKIKWEMSVAERI
jgi:hypothetical protein